MISSSLPAELFHVFHEHGWLSLPKDEVHVLILIECEDLYIYENQLHAESIFCLFIDTQCVFVTPF